MENIKNKVYVKRTQKDYTMSFNIQVVQEIESGELSSTPPLVVGRFTFRINYFGKAIASAVDHPAVGDNLLKMIACWSIAPTDHRD